MKNSYTNYDVYKKRIAQVQAQLKDGEIFVLFAAEHQIRNRDVEYKFRQDSDFFYLTGINESNSILVLSKKYSCMFCLPKVKEQEIWTGIRLGKDFIKKSLSLSEAFDLEEWDKKLPELLLNHHSLYYFFGVNSKRDQELLHVCQTVCNRARDGKFGPEKIIQPSFLHEMRLIKSEIEIELLKESAEITKQGHMRLMRETKPGMMEYELEALLEETYLRNGAWGGGYGHIVAGGKNACVLHYVANNEVLQNGDLVLVDSGAEKNYLTADVTRTFPVGKKFTEVQAYIYEIVLASQKNAISMVQQGKKFYDIQDATVRFLVTCLLEMNILEGSVEENIENGSYKRFYMHKIGHYLGMDVHDVGKYFIEGKRRNLENGMVVTIEPGLYFDPEDESLPDDFRGIGIRIEDNILVSGKKPINLTQAIPKEIIDIESLKS
ncbi:MAG: aminopeptidase P N-terminal domain-containing protein [Leptospiraceae bacterium]|nr:aminopeptidase P N-terminal domain-containing protein [Leptospiraceae bacterium]